VKLPITQRYQYFKIKISTTFKTKKSRQKEGMMMPQTFIVLGESHLL